MALADCGPAVAPSVQIVLARPSAPVVEEAGSTAAGLGFPVDRNVGDRVSELIGYPHHNRVEGAPYCSGLLVSAGDFDAGGGSGSDRSCESSLERVRSGTAIDPGNHRLGSAGGAEHPQRAGCAIRSGRCSLGRDLCARQPRIRAQSDGLTRQRFAPTIENADLERIRQGRSDGTLLSVAGDLEPAGTPSLGSTRSLPPQPAIAVMMKTRNGMIRVQDTRGLQPFR